MPIKMELLREFSFTLPSGDEREDIVLHYYPPEDELYVFLDNQWLRFMLYRNLSQFPHFEDAQRLSQYYNVSPLVAYHYTYQSHGMCFDFEKKLKETFLTLAHQQKMDNAKATIH